MNPKSQKEYRCRKCEKLLASETYSSAISIKCHRCGSITSFDLEAERQIIITDKNGTILSINKKMEEVTGYALSEVIGKKPSIWGKQMPDSFYKNMWSKLIMKKSVTVDLQNKTKSGKSYNVRLHIEPFLDNNKEIAFFLGEEVEFSS